MRETLRDILKLMIERELLGYSDAVNTVRKVRTKLQRGLTQQDSYSLEVLHAVKCLELYDWLDNQ